MTRRKRAVLELAHPNAAGIDIGSASHFLAVPSDRDDEPVREFKSFTDDLDALADWLLACEVDTVAMESTGGYWIPLFKLLESRGLRVYLVNARHVKPSVGSKADSYDNALAETINGLNKAELIHRRAPWKTVESLELATLEWVTWFNHQRLLEPIGYIPPAKAEDRYYRQLIAQAEHAST